MKTQKLIAGLFRICAIALLFAIVPTSIWAQNDESAGPTYINFRIQTVKQGRVPEWESIRKERTEAARRAGRPYYHVYQRVRGPGNGFLIVSPEEGIGEPGGNIDIQPAIDRQDSWFNAIGGTLDSQLVLSLQFYPDLRTIPDGPVHPSAKFVHLRIRTAAAGRSGDFEKWLRDDLIPGLRRVDVGDVRIARVVLGGNPRTWVTASFVDGWPYSNENPVNPRMLAKGDAMVATRTDYFYEFRDDLSFTAD